MNNENRYENFKKPSNIYRGKPFWAWNGDLKEEELKRQIDVMKEMGFGGYFMHSRVGLVTEYLGEEWFRLINACTDYGTEQGMENWIYDEDRWPSGAAGGIATKEMSNRMKYIRMHVGAVSEGADVVGIFSCRLDGENVYEVSQVVDEREAAGDVIWFEVITRPGNSNYNGATYLDTMNREATEAFLNCTHERYLKECGDRMGTTIKGVFTDEPHRGELLIDMVREGLDFADCIPYTDALFARFKEDWGYDLCEKLPAIFLRENGEKVSQVKWHYCETLQRLFLENYIKPISEWCKNHQMIYTGHMLHEDSLSAQAIMNGSLMRCYEYMDYPGIDLLGSENDNYNIAKQVSSVANQCGQKWILSEMYGVSGWEMKLEDYKRIGDWQAILGVNLRCPHLSWYTMAGECKRDCPASIFFQSCWYKEYRYLEDYYARLAVFMEQGEPDRKVLVINPIESMWCSYYRGWAAWLITKDEECLELEKDYEEFARFLLKNNVEFDYGDEEILSRLARVEGDTFIVGRASYKQVIIPRMITMRSSTLALLKEFEKAGGEVIVYGEAPKYVDAKPAEVMIGNASMESVFTKRELVAEDERILSSYRRSEDGKIYIMFLNTDCEHAIVTKVSLPAGEAEQWNPETGEVAGVEINGEITFQPGELKLLSVGGEQRALAVKEELPVIQLKERFRYETEEPNVLVIDKAVCSFEGERIEGDILDVDCQIRELLDLPMRGGEMYQPWFTAKKEPKKYFSFELQYEFDSVISCEAFLATEAAGTILVNDQVVAVSEDWWVDPCFKKAPIWIQKGHNVITIQDMYTERQDFEAVYILGEFGVFHGVIDQKPENILLGDITTQGFPHYSGKLRYVFEQTVSERSVLKLPNMCGAAAIRVNEKILAWPPYVVEVEPCREVEVVLSLTRRNTFGTLEETDVVPCGLTI